MKTKANNLINRGFIAVIAAFTLGTGVAMAVEDYTRYNNEELFQLRNQTRDMDSEEKLRFREELQNRTRDMSAEEKQRLRVNEDNVQGRGERKRLEDQESESNYGRGYESRQNRPSMNKGSRPNSMGGGSRR